MKIHLILYKIYENDNYKSLIRTIFASETCFNCLSFVKKISQLQSMLEAICNESASFMLGYMERIRAAVSAIWSVIKHFTIPSFFKQSL